MNDKLCSEISRVSAVAQNLKDSSLAPPSEASTKERLGLIQEYHQLIQDSYFHDPAAGKPQSSIKNHLETLLMSQIAVLKVFNSTPIHGYNVGVETLEPATLAILILKVVLMVSDSLPPERPADKKAERRNLRKKFIQNDGLKFLFGIRVTDPHCNDPESFRSKAKLSDFL